MPPSTDADSRHFNAILALPSRFGYPY